MVEGDEAERAGIQSLLMSLEQHFERLQEAAGKRMSRLQEAAKMAGRYEDRSNQFDQWLGSAEGRLASLGHFAIASQPLQTQLSLLKVRQASLLSLRGF